MLRFTEVPLCKHCFRLRGSNSADNNLQREASSETKRNVFFSSAFDDQIDKQGRITLPTALREYARLDRDVIVVGADTTVEIWDPKAWQTYLAEAEPKFASTAEEVVPGIF